MDSAYLLVSVLALLRFAYANSSATQSEHTLLINVTNYSALRLDQPVVGYFGLC